MFVDFERIIDFSLFKNDDYKRALDVLALRFSRAFFFVLFPFRW